MRRNLPPPCRCRKSSLTCTGARLLAGLLGLAASIAAYAQPPGTDSPPENFRDRIVFATRFELERQLASLTQLRDAARWQDATAIIQQLLQDEPDAVVEAEPHRYLSLRSWLHSEIAAWPVEGREFYRVAVDPAANPRYQDALIRRDVQAMQEVSQEFFGSTFFDDACWQLAHWAWEDGDVAAAENYWMRLLPRASIVSEGSDVRLAQPMEGDFPPDEVLARLALCRVFLRGEHESRSAVEAYGEMFPAATAELAGLSGLTAETLAAVLDESQAWDRDAIHDQATYIGGWSWSRDLPVSLPLLALETALDQIAPVPPTQEVLISGDQLIVIGPHRIQVLKSTTGEPQWPAGDEPDDGTVYSNRAADETGPILSGEGGPQAGGVIANGRVYATLGWPIVVPAESEMRELPSRIVCLDVERSEGRIRWIAEDSDVLPANWRFCGGPVIVDGRLLAPTTTETGPIALGLAALDAISGESLWHREICGVVDQRPARTHLYGSEHISVSHGHILWPTRYGCVLKIEATSGRVAWAVSYPSIEQREATSRRAPFASMQAIVEEGVVYLVGVSQRRILAIDEAHGVVRWTTSLPGRVSHLVGVRNGILVAGGEALWGIEASTGVQLWKCGFDSPDGACAGTGVIAGNTIWWTTHNELIGTDLHSGELTARHAIGEAWNLRGGDLFLAPRQLFLLEPGCISEFEMR